MRLGARNIFESLFIVSNHFILILYCCHALDKDKYHVFFMGFFVQDFCPRTFRTLDLSPDSVSS